MVHPTAAAVHLLHYPPAAAVIPPLLLKGRPVPRCRTSSTPTRAIASQPAPGPLNSRRRCTDRAGGTSLYHFAAILPRTSPVGGRSRPEDLIPPPAPRWGEWWQAGFPGQALSGLEQPCQREACLHGLALIAPPRPPHGGSCPRGRLRRCAPPPTARGDITQSKRHRPAARQAGSSAALRSRASRLPAIGTAASAAAGGDRYRHRSPGRAPTPRAARLGQHLGTRPSSLVWPACPALAGTPAPQQPSARRPGPEDLILPPAPRWGVVVVTSLYRFALVATGSPPFGRSFTPPPLRSISVHSLPLSGRPSASTATLPRSRRGGASCRRGAGIHARARAILAGILP